MNVKELVVEAQQIIKKIWNGTRCLSFCDKCNVKDCDPSGCKTMMQITAIIEYQAQALALLDVEPSEFVIKAKKHLEQLGLLAKQDGHTDFLQTLKQTYRLLCEACIIIDQQHAENRQLKELGRTVVLCFPEKIPKGQDKIAFNIPAYIIEELKEAVKEK